MDITPKLDLVVLDCPDAMELARFYSGLLGWPLEDGSGEAFATLAPPGGGVTPDNPNGRATLAFQRIEGRLVLRPDQPDPGGVRSDVVAEGLRIHGLLGAHTAIGALIPGCGS